MFRELLKPKPDIIEEGNDFNTDEEVIEVAEPSKKFDGSVTSFLIELVALAGIPGVAFVGFVFSLVTGVYSSDQMYLWIGLLAFSIVYAAWNSSSKLSTGLEKHSRYTASEHMEMSESINKMAHIITNLLTISGETYAAVSGKISAKHVHLILPLLIDSLKWRLLSIIVPSWIEIRRAGSPKNVDLSVFMTNGQVHLDSVLIPFSVQHNFFKDERVIQQLRGAFDYMFSYICSDEFNLISDKSKQDTEILRQINMTFAEVSNDLLAYLRETYNS